MKMEEGEQKLIEIKHQYRNGGMCTSKREVNSIKDT